MTLLDMLSLLILIAVVFGLIQGLTALIEIWKSHKKKPEEEVVFDDLTFGEFEKIRASYAKLLENSGLKIMDESCLPASKENIKKVILALMATADAKEERDGLGAAYVLLSRFLPGVGPKAIEPPMEDLEKVSEALPQASKENLQIVGEHLKQYLHWLHKSRDEMKKLQAELKVLEGRITETSGSDTSTSQRGEIKTVEISRIKPWPISQKQLSPLRMLRIQKIYQVFQEVDNFSIEERIDDFDRDLNVDNEIDIWEKMAEAYTKYTSKHKVTLEEKQEVYRILLLRSMAPEEWVLKNCKRNLFSDEKAKEIMSYYKR